MYLQAVRYNEGILQKSNVGVGVGVWILMKVTCWEGVASRSVTGQGFTPGRR